MYCYCLYCQTNKCESLINNISKKLNCTAIYPVQTRYRRVEGKVREVKQPLLPGYIFLYGEEMQPDLSELRIDGVFRVLTNPDGDPVLRGMDQRFALTVFQKNGRFGRMEVVQIGQVLMLKSGMFAGLPAKVLKVDRRYTRMQVEVTLFEQPVKIWMEYQIV